MVLYSQDDIQKKQKSSKNAKNTDTNKHQTKTIIREVECKR